MVDTVTISGTQYSLLAGRDDNGWRKVQDGRPIHWEYVPGGGMGKYRDDGGPGYFMASNIDTTGFPFIRLRQSAIISETAAGGLTGFSSSVPFYVERIIHAGTLQPYNLIFSDDYVYKFRMDTLARVNVRQFASGVAGRPTFFDDGSGPSLWSCWGGSVEIQKLTTLTSDTSNDTWTPSTGTGIFANHLRAAQSVNSASVIIQVLARSVGSQVSISTDGVTFGGAFTVANPWEHITDLGFGQGELIVFKGTNAIRFDQYGNSLPLQEYLQNTIALTSQGNGSMSRVAGPMIIWNNAAGLWLFEGGIGGSIGPESRPDFQALELDGFTLAPSISEDSTYTSSDIFGHWVYMAHGSQVFAGRYQGGEITWHGSLYTSPSGSAVRVAVAYGATFPVLWVADGTALQAFRLAPDGGPSFGVQSAGARGTSSEAARIWGPRVEGPPEFAPYLKQWRKMGIQLEDAHADQPWTLRAHMNGDATSTALGAATTAEGLTERSWTVGSNDLARYIIPQLSCTPLGTGTADSRVVKWWADGLAPSVYRARIDLTETSPGSNSRRGKSGEEMLKALRNLKDGAAVNIRAPDENANFSSYVVGVTETQTKGTETAGAGWSVDVLLLRFDYSGEAA